MEKLKEKLKSNNGFTIQDVVIAMFLLVLFAGIIGSLFLAIYRIQIETRITAAVSLYSIQILENIDKISYEDVKTGIEQNYKEAYNIPDGVELKLEVRQYNQEDTIKFVTLTMNYEVPGRTETLVLEKIKVKEV